MCVHLTGISTSGYYLKIWLALFKLFVSYVHGYVCMYIAIYQIFLIAKAEIQDVALLDLLLYIKMIITLINCYYNNCTV